MAHNFVAAAFNFEKISNCLNVFLRSVALTSATKHYSTYDNFIFTAFLPNVILIGMFGDAFPVSGVQVLVDPKPNGIFQFRDACPLVSGSSCESNVGWFLNDYRNCLFASPAFDNYKTDNACYVHAIAVRSCLWFCRQALCRHIRREWISLAPILGDSLPAAFLLQCLYINVVLYPLWTCKFISRDERPSSISLLDPSISVLHHLARGSTTIMWSCAFCKPW